MNPRKILWLSNFCFSENLSHGTGTWIEAMGKALLQIEGFELSNITVGKVSGVERSDYRGMKQWIIPLAALGRSGYPDTKTIGAIQQIADEVKPDLIHVWGVERFWGLLTARKLLPYPALLEMQGIRYAMTPYMAGGLTVLEQMSCYNLKELLRPSLSVFYGQEFYRKCKAWEVEIIEGHEYIDYQSDWVKAYLEPYSAGKNLFRTKMMMRPEFLSGAAWTHDKQRALTIFSSVGIGGSPNKGAHILLRAVALLRKSIPNVKLVIAGSTLQKGIRLGGYARFLMREIKHLGLEDCITILGNLNAVQLVEYMQSASVVVVPSFVESYSMTLVEAMAVGAPVVVSYAGAMPELAIHNESALFFPAGDCGVCAQQIKRILESSDLAMKLGENARIRSLSSHQPSDVLLRQIEIYNKIFQGCH